MTMMENAHFEACYLFAGRYFKDDADTKFGIRKSRFPNLQVRKLTEEDARAIYYSEFYLGYNCHILADTSRAVSFCLFDSVVDSGGEGVRFLKDALRIRYPDLGNSGRVDLETCAAVKFFGDDFLLTVRMREERLRFCSDTLTDPDGLKTAIRRIVDLGRSLSVYDREEGQPPVIRVHTDLHGKNAYYRKDLRHETVGSRTDQ